MVLGKNRKLSVGIILYQDEPSRNISINQENGFTNPLVEKLNHLSKKINRLVEEHESSG